MSDAMIIAVVVAVMIVVCVIGGAPAACWTAGSTTEVSYER